MNYPVYSKSKKEQEHEYNIVISKDKDGNTCYTLYFTNSSIWSTHIRNTQASCIKDTGNGFIFPKLGKEIQYDEAVELLILLSFIKNKSNLSNDYEIREPSEIIVKI